MHSCKLYPYALKDSSDTHTHMQLAMYAAYLEYFVQKLWMNV